MPWFRVDDTLAFHEKAVAAGNAAMGLWVRAGAWSMQLLTDGWIPSTIAEAIGDPHEIRALVDVGLWTPETRKGANGYVFHDWGDRQPSSVQIRSEREAARARQQRAREAARQKRENKRRMGGDSTVHHLANLPK